MRRTARQKWRWPVWRGCLKQHQDAYYRHLSAIRTQGDWESWVSFFLKGVAVAATEAERGIVAIASQAAADRRRLLASPKAGPASYPCIPFRIK